MTILKSKLFWVILSIITFIIVMISFMPKPINMNLDKIGNGQKSVVFVYDPNLAVSNKQTIEINKARDIIGEQANFLTVASGDPKSESFIKQYHARSPDLLFFDSNGKLMGRQVALLNSEELIKKLSEK